MLNFVSVHITYHSYKKKIVDVLQPNGGSRSTVFLTVSFAWAASRGHKNKQANIDWKRWNRNDRNGNAPFNTHRENGGTLGMVP